MNRNRSSFLKGLRALALALPGLALGLPGTALAQAVVLKIGTVDAPASHSGQGAEAFALIHGGLGEEVICVVCDKLKAALIIHNQFVLGAIGCTECHTDCHNR